MKNYTITVNGIAYEVSVQESNGLAGAAPVQQAVTPAPAPVAAPQAAPAPAAPAPAAPAPAVTGSKGSVEIESPMPGKILSIPVEVGQAIKKGDVIVILEAMKMENEIVAGEDGTVASINVSMGQMIESGALIATLD